jgi:hypothetical protein
MGRMVKILIIGSLLVLPLSLAAPVVVMAHEGEDHTTTSEAREEKANTLREEAKERAQTKLSEAKKRVCENRAKNIDAIMARSIKRAEHQGKLFTTIAERVEAFYAKKGKVVANYDQLVAAVDAAKANLDTNLATLKAVDFSCDSDDPKGNIEEFKEAHHMVLDSLKTLRTSVKDLIVGVRSAQGGEQ